MTRGELERYIIENYGEKPDFPWDSSPEFAVFRHNNGKKWFALIMTIDRGRLGLSGEGVIDVVNLKCHPILRASLTGEPGFFPAYHMNKEHWISVALDGSAQDDKIKMLLDMSYESTAPKIKNKNNKKET